MKQIVIILICSFFGKNLFAQNSYMTFLESKQTVHKAEYVPSFKAEGLDLKYLDKNQSDYLRQMAEDERKSQIKHEKLMRMYDNIEILKNKIYNAGLDNKYNNWNEESLRYEVYDIKGNKVGYFEYDMYYEKFNFVGI